MKLIRNIRLDNYKLYSEGEARKIFSVGYENLTAFIYYQDGKNIYKLVVAKDDNPPVVIEKDITRAQAFRLMNTRP
ncbi:PH domain-containing protein [Pontibacter pamirensis]|uniref:hypothetical protein n=1 Tax=Pontibacter pamirensis TaxID=2562824 RepID=UPI00138A323B|nr:hypothetical protein [Pontibacter pamirensis]